MILSGKCSWFGGPDDVGVAPDEGLAFIYELDDAPHLFLPQQPPGTTGLARRLDPSKFYIACRWDYAKFPKEDLIGMKVLVHSPETGESFLAEPADWGPHVDTNRVADLSPGLMSALGITTDDLVEVTIPAPGVVVPGEPFVFVISSGHGLKIRGAEGYIDEVDENRRVVNRVAQIAAERGIAVYVFHDNTSTSQQQNLDTIVAFHNRQTRNLDVSVHFNAYNNTDSPMGTECLYYSQSALAERVSSQIATAGGLKNRGPKQNIKLQFLYRTTEPAILIEVCFVDSKADVEAYKKNFEKICTAIVDSII